MNEEGKYPQIQLHLNDYHLLNIFHETMTAENTISSEELAKDKYLLELIFNNYYEQERSMFLREKYN